MPMDSGMEVATKVIDTIIVAIIQKLTDVIEFEANLQILDTDFTTMCKRE